MPSKTTPKEVKKNSGLFLTLEGTEGAGKSTLIQLLKARFEKAGVEVLATREPGGHPIAEKLRRIVLDEDVHPWTELFIYEAARAEHVHRVILPALRAGKVVLCDRFTDSTLAYQGQGRGISWNEVRWMNQRATQGLTPDLTLWLDLPPALGLSRARELTRFEAAGVAFQTQVRKGFLKSKRLEPKRWLVLDAGKKTAETLAQETWDALVKRFGKKLKWLS